MFFKGSDTGDSQPQEPHIFQSTFILRTACIREPPQSPSLAHSKQTHTFSHRVTLKTHTRYYSHPLLSLCNIFTQPLRPNHFQSHSYPTKCASKLSILFTLWKGPRGLLNACHFIADCNVWFRDIFVTCNTQGANLNEDNWALNVIVWHEKALNQQRRLEYRENNYTLRTPECDLARHSSAP